MSKLKSEKEHLERARKNYQDGKVQRALAEIDQAIDYPIPEVRINEFCSMIRNFGVITSNVLH